MQSFYRRFVRDYVRYKDEIQCAGDAMIRAVRADALRNDPSSGGEYYALHVRRGDFQYYVSAVGNSINGWLNVRLVLWLDVHNCRDCLLLIELLAAGCAQDCL